MWIGPSPAAMAAWPTRSRPGARWQRPACPSPPAPSYAGHRSRRRARCRRRARLSADGQGQRRRRRDRHGRRARRRLAAFGVRQCPEPGRAALRIVRHPARALSGGRPARRGADPRAQRRPGPGARGARLLGAASSPEDRRGDPVAWCQSAAAGPAAATRRCGPAARWATSTPAPSNAWWHRATVQEFVFLEMNTRLQVEHPITELRHGYRPGRGAAADRRRAGADVRRRAPASQGHALELRVYAEDPVRFLPGPGTISRYVEPAGDGIRVDSGYADGDVVTPHYDPLLAKLCVWAPDRAAMLAGAARGGRRLRGRRSEGESGRSSSGCWPTRPSSAATTTRDWWRR